MWALKPPRRPRKPEIKAAGGEPERTPPEPKEAPEQALPTNDAWAWPGATDFVDSMLSLGGVWTEDRRAGRILAYYVRDLEAEAARWATARDTFEREAAAVEAAATQQQVQLRRWGLRRLRRPFAELAAARINRARAQAAAAAAAGIALGGRTREAEALRGDADRRREAVLEEGFCGLAPRDVLARSATLKARRSRLHDKDGAVERAAAQARTLRSRVVAKTAPERVALLRKAAAAAADADAILSNPKADTAERRTAAQRRSAAEADGDEVLEDERHREGRLLSKWRARVAGDAAPRAILAFSNRFAEDVGDAFGGIQHRAALASLAARLCTRGGRSFLVPRRRLKALAASDRRFHEARQRVRTRLRNLPRADVERLVGCQAPQRYDDHPAAALRVLDDLSQPPARLVEAVFECFARIACQSSVMGAEDALGLAVHALATGNDGPARPSTGLYVARVYGVRDPALRAGDRDAEAKYLLTTLEAAVAAVVELGDGDRPKDSETSATEDETDPYEEVDFAALAAEADADAGAGDDPSLGELGAWLGSERAREDTVDLLRDEGWVR